MEEPGVRRVQAVESFEPTAAPWPGAEVNVTVRVRNHRTMAEGAAVTVTVARHACRNLRTSSADGDSLTCTVVAAVRRYSEGPVKVVYVGGRELAVMSKESFVFVVPEALQCRVGHERACARAYTSVPGALGS